MAPPNNPHPHLQEFMPRPLNIKKKNPAREENGEPIKAQDPVIDKSTLIEEVIKGNCEPHNKHFSRSQRRKEFQKAMAKAEAAAKAEVKTKAKDVTLVPELSQQLNTDQAEEGSSSNSDETPGDESSDFDDPLLPTEICHWCSYRIFDEERGGPPYVSNPEVRLKHYIKFFAMKSNYLVRCLDLESGIDDLLNNGGFDMNRKKTKRFWEDVRSKLKVYDEEVYDSEDEVDELPEIKVFKEKKPLRLSQLNPK